MTLLTVGMIGFITGVLFAGALIGQLGFVAVLLIIGSGMAVTAVCFRRPLLAA
jgi:hypothetical protein